MFTDFFYYLRQSGLEVSVTEWLTFIRALTLGHARSDLAGLYGLARSLLVKRVSDYDLYDRAFAAFFKDVDAHFELDEAILSWLEEAELPELPELPPGLEPTPFQDFDLEQLRRDFEQRLREQDERHDGGSRWVGTGGTSAFGQGGAHPAGIRVGGRGGGRSAVQVAGSRRFRNLRSDRILDTRQITLALRRLRKLDRQGAAVELDLEGTIDKSARNGGEIDILLAPEKKNRIKLLLMIDVGGSMDPHARICELLFSAAHRGRHFKRLEYRFFHNCPYERVFTDISQWRGQRTADLLRELDSTWSVILVGDAWMSPFELSRVGGALGYGHRNADSGLDWLRRIRERCPNSVWLNPEPEHIWRATTIATIRRVFPMFELTLDGLAEAMDVLRGARANRPLSGATRMLPR